MKNLDDKHRRIIKALQQNPKASARMLEELTGIATSTILKRLKWLEDEGIVEHVLKVNEQTFALRSLVYVDVNLPELNSTNFSYSNISSFARFLEDGLLRHKIAATFKDKILIERVEILLGGENDLLVFVAASDPHTVFEFVAGVVRNLAGVRNTHTALVFSAKESFKAPKAPRALRKN